MKDLGPMLERIKGLFTPLDDDRGTPIAPLPTVTVEQFAELTRLSQGRGQLETEPAVE